MSARGRWADWVPLGLFLVLTAWLVGGALLESVGGPGASKTAWSSSAVESSSAAAPAVLLPAPAPTEPVSQPENVAVGTSVLVGVPAAGLVSADWARAAASATGIPHRALLGYAGAALRLANEQPDCRLGWTTLAALGSIESDHGSHDGSAIGADGVAAPGIYGPLLDGSGYDVFVDTDAGRWDANTEFDRAVGPLQFIPATWDRWGADGNGDGTADPQQIDDAALATGRYLCDSGDLSAATAWRAAVYSYNHVESYVDSVAVAANGYAARMP
ncbi:MULTISPECIES: lytic transglycosylase domain-containing protein [unclassified Cryobacterium]|uniref:lytic transglycosylase domain-containing protein n=1 Tax=unclassified Cryobacterium TaxID=2649013 RepID=UPI00141B2E1A|nr:MULTISPECIES: lytic transglycosylase domain-containing protein [unclassified Cryobacterium]